MKLQWLPIAVANRDNQFDWLVRRNPRAALAMSEAIDAAVERLLDFPRSGRPGAIPETRELVVAGTPYLIVYRVETEAVVILRLLHGAQRWPDTP